MSMSLNPAKENPHHPRVMRVLFYIQLKLIFKVLYSASIKSIGFTLVSPLSSLK
jgi:hypothetical protein